MLKLIFTLSFVVFSSSSFGDVLSCGSTAVAVSDAPSPKDPYFKVMLKNELITKTYYFDIQNDHLHARCDITESGIEVLFINNACGGSGCADYGNFGIIDLRTGAVLLEPDQRYKGNMQKAKEIMGKEIKKFSCYNESDERDEICLYSKIELG